MESPESPGQKPYPGFWQAIGICVLYALAAFVVIVPLIGVGMALDVRIEDNPASIALVTLASTVWILSLFRARTEITPDVLAGPLALPLRAILPILFAVIGILIADAPLLAWLSRNFPALRHAGDYGFENSPLGAFVLLVLVAPLSEELLFRAMFLRGFESRYGRAIALPLSAALFAMAHYYPIKLIHTFLTGLLFGWLYLRFRAIWPGVFAHAVNNFAAFLLLLYPPTQIPPWWLLPAGAIAAAPALYLLHRNPPPRSHPPSVPPSL
ncbi:MAG: CPBP family intramembrane metalloprotease [Bryobacterales bacterium]|nr:CPBP family intramembrane metalloprotease [Bryobacterales bacterium]